MICMVDRLADAINTIKTHERVGARECVIDSTKMIRSVLDTMKKEGYVEGYEEFVDRNAAKLRVALSNKINSVGVIKPRFSVSKNDIQRYEARYIPSKDFGTLIISTPKGVLTGKEAKSQGIGGKLLAYVY